MDSDAAAAALARDKAEVARLGEEVRRLRRAGGDTRGRVSALVEEIKAIRKRRIDDANAAANRKRVRAHARAVTGADHCCQQWIKARGRFCRMERARGARYCAAHLSAKSGDVSLRSTKRRKKNLAQATVHSDGRPFYSCGVNRDRASSGSSGGTASDAGKTEIPRDPASIRAFDARVQRLIESAVPHHIPSATPRLHELQPESCRAHIEEAKSLARISAGIRPRAAAGVAKSNGSGVQDSSSTDASAPSESPSAGDGPTTRLLKHTRQIASIIGNMESARLAPEPHATTFVELGAGKATLSGMLSETLSGRGASYVLIDRGTGFRNKCDRKMRNRPEMRRDTPLTSRT